MGGGDDGAPFDGGRSCSGRLLDRAWVAKRVQELPDALLWSSGRRGKASPVLVWLAVDDLGTLEVGC